MPAAGLSAFMNIWFVDFEFSQAPGGLPRPICLSALELRSGQLRQLWEDELARLTAPPFPIDACSLYCGYLASAELGCHLALGRPLPARILDPYVEFRHLLNGTRYEAARRGQKGVRSLLGALLYYGLNGTAAEEKHDMRQLALRGGPYTADERTALLAYNATDVHALAQLLPRMLPGIDLPQALQRGRYMKAVAHMEQAGIPADTPLLSALQTHRPAIEARLIAAVNPAYGVYEGGSFRQARFERWLQAQGIRDWPRTASGRLQVRKDAFRAMARRYPQVAPLGRLLRDLDQLCQLDNLKVGPDGRARCLLSPFTTLTSRTHPNSKEYLFFQAAWVRRVIRPEPGRALIYCDYEQQEFAVAACFSEDPAMLAAYASGDPYMLFAIQAGAAPAGATKATHGAIREQYKACSLAMLYGMGPPGLARRLGQPLAVASELYQAHRRTYPRFWRWLDATIALAVERGVIRSVFGWTYRTEGESNHKKLLRSLANFPMQSAGAEIIRLAACYATEQGITVCATVHDALLVECAVAEVPQVVALTRKAMAHASAKVLRGFELRTDEQIIRYPERYVDPRGQAMWETIQPILADLAHGVGE
jgi:DNA polymerase-1